MKYLTDIQTAHTAPQELELLFQTAQKENGVTEFKADLLTCYRAAPDNVLYAAWYYRFERIPLETPAERRAINWKLALPISLATGLIVWLLSAERFAHKPSNMPYLALLAAPIIGLFTLAFLSLTAKAGYRRALVVGGGLTLAVAYTLLLASTRQHYRELMIPHLFLLSWAAVGAGVIGLGTPPKNKFAFLIKSVEVMVTGGVYLIATLIFSGIALNMFTTLDIRIPEAINRLMYVGLGGVIPLLAIASVYDPMVSPASQEFKRGVGRLIITFPRILLGLTLVVLIIYLIAIPFNFMAPFKNREVLITYNLMLFAVMGLLVGATPVTLDDLSPRYQTALRVGILAVTSVVIVISLYALAAVVYRTMDDVLTINRLTIIGWNTINIVLLTLLIYRQLRGGAAVWLDSLHWTFSTGIVLYIAWAVFLTLATPWLF
ncbi:MAG TPA: hypothetical protein VI547_13975 [Anaerolineales bacterium]|nr:hypothetical protein [Anaerolineales bacterium]